jgi:hypothetical protein
VHWSDVKNFFDVSQSVVTTLAIVAAAIAAYASGLFSSTLQLRSNLVHVIERDGYKAAIVTVQFKNIGRTKCAVREAYYRADSISDRDPASSGITAIAEPSNLDVAKMTPIIPSSDSLNFLLLREEEVDLDLYIPLEESANTFSVTVIAGLAPRFPILTRLIYKRPPVLRWQHRKIFDVSMIERPK